LTTASCLYRSPDLLAIGWLANFPSARSVYGNTCFFQTSIATINPTNVCVAHLQAMRLWPRFRNAPGAYTFALEEIYQRAEQGLREGATEFSHGRRPAPRSAVLNIFLDLMRGFEKTLPYRTPESVFTMVEGGIFFAHFKTFDSRHAFLALKEAGVDSLARAAARKNFFIRACGKLFATIRSAGSSG